MTFADFKREVDRLRGLPFAPADYQTHWLGLRDLPLDVLAFAVTRAARVCERFPTPAELRTLADTRPAAMTSAPDQRARPLDTPVVITPPFLSKPITLDREWRYYCEDCSDGGMVSLWCDRADGSAAGLQKPHATQKPWQIVEQCARVECPYPHEWVRECACIFTNPAIARKREAQARYAEQRQERRR
jgi:hypothetical protein